MAKNRPLILEHLEHISSEVFERYAKVITRLVDRRNGIYALYKDDDLYYVGLASNLKSRLHQHLRDRHQGLWDRFNVYLTVDDRYLREMEAMLLRIAKPDGNRVTGKLSGSRDLKRELAANIREQQHMERLGILGKHVPGSLKKSKAIDDEEDLFNGRTVFLKREYKGKEYRASYRRDGTVLLNGKIFESLSGAGKSITKRATNGWRFWKARNDDGEWVTLNEFKR